MATTTSTMLFQDIEKASHELQQLLSSLTEEQLNKVPFKDSWTPAQLATHVAKSNKGMVQALQMEGVPANRDIAKRIKELEETFLNFELKLKSPDFIVPAPGHYKKEEALNALKQSSDAMCATIQDVSLSEMIDMPKTFGSITKLELCHFVLYHTQRHIHQLKKMLPYIQ